MERVKGRQKSWPLVTFLRGKNGSFSGTGIGRHSGWMVRAASHRRQSRILWRGTTVSRRCHAVGRIGLCGILPGLRRHGGANGNHGQISMDRMLRL